MIACALPIVFLLCFLTSHSDLHAQPLGDTTLAVSQLTRAYRMSVSSQYDSAIVLFEEAARVFEKAELWSRYVYALNGIAEGLLNTIRVDSSLHVLRKARNIGDNKGISQTTRAYTYELLSLANIYSDQFATALRFANTCLAIRSGSNDERPATIARAYALVASVQARMGHQADAGKNYSVAVDICKSGLPETREQLAHIYLSLGEVLNAICQYDSSVVVLNEAIRLFTELGEVQEQGAANCYASLAVAYDYSGHSEKALPLYESALSIYQQLGAGNNPTVGIMYSAIAQVYRRQGAYDVAQEYMEKALSATVKAKGSDHTSVAAIYNMMAELYSQRGDAEQAKGLARKALSIRGMKYGTGHPALLFSYEELGDIARRNSQPEDAVENYRMALASWSGMGGDPDVIYARLKAKNAEALIACGRYDEAARALGEAEAIDHDEKGFNILLTLQIQQAFAELYRKQSDMPLALAYYQRAISTICPQFSDTSIAQNPLDEPPLEDSQLIRLLAAKAELLQQFYDRTQDVGLLQSALAAYISAARYMGQNRRKYDAEGTKLAIGIQRDPIYQDAVDLAMRLFQITHDSVFKVSAFQLAERSKARVLLDGIFDSHVRHFAGIPDNLLAKESSIKSQLSSIEIRLSASLSEEDCDSTRLGYFRNRKFELDRELRHFERSLERDYPAYFALKFADHVPNISSIQQALSQRTILVEYFVSHRAIYAFTVSKDSLDVAVIAKPEDLADMTSSFLQSIKKLHVQQFLRLSSALHALVIAPIAPRLDRASHVIIIPDGPLYYVPFETLAPAGGNIAASDFSGLQYLIRSFSITYSFSSSFYVSTAGQRHGSPVESFVGFAPVFRDSIESGVLLASNGTQSKNGNARSLLLNGRRFDELPYSKDEVVSISQLFEKHGMTGTGYFDDEATEARFRTEAAHSSIIHIATHGFFNEEHPALSALLFSGPQQKEHGNDNILYAGEAYNLKLQADLLVLSSCESGFGKLVKGEGLMGMTRGFFYAGVRNIIFSLWKVYDKHTNVLMQRFYESLLQGDDYSNALRRAKLALIADPATAFPAQWAGFMLVGR